MQSKSETILPVISSKVRTIGSIVLLVLTMLFAVGHIPYFILSAFFTFQLVVKMFSFHEGAGISFREAILVGPAKVLTAGFMIASGIPDNNEGFFWIGCSFLILCSGIKNLHFVMRLMRTSQAVPATAGVGRVETVSVRQRTKETKAEDQLFDDLADFLANIDPKDDKG